MDTGQTLIELLIVLVAAKAAAELSERLNVPAVLGEIVAGILIGPSVLNLIHKTEASTEFLAVVGELGVILLLLQVGMEMDLAEMGRVGKASLAVAFAGVAAPFLGGYAVLHLAGEPTTTAIFLGAALTATSVGITARAFGDLKALASVEARVVIGAAVADDVLGLIVLTVVARLVSTGSIEVGGVIGVIALALGFLVVTSAAGLTLAPPIFAAIQRRSRSSGTMIALAFAFTLAFAQLAHMAQLAPIVGAFVAGLSLSRSRQAERIMREITPLSHILVPIFFLQIGADADLGALAKPSVLGLAAIMSAVAVVGKVVAGWAAVGTTSDRLLVGLGMIPRGEVGLIFATIGKGAGVLDDDLYAALLIVVLATTVITPPLLRSRVNHVRAAAIRDRAAASVRPDGGWLTVSDGRVLLAAEPPPDQVLQIGLQAAALCSDAAPGTDLLEWFGSVKLEDEVAWDPAAVEELHLLLRTGGPRSWRFLDAIGLLDAAMPEVAEAVLRRRGDAGELDPGRLHRWPTLERLLALADAGGGDRETRDQFHLVGDPDLLLVAALCVDVCDGAESPATTARALSARFGYDVLAQERIAALVGDADLLRAAASRTDALQEDRVLPLAAHLETSLRARSAYLLSVALADLSELQRELIDALHRELQEILGDLELLDGGSLALIEARRRSGIEAAGDVWEARRIATAPRSVLATSTPQELVERVGLLGSVTPPRGYVRVRATPIDRVDGRVGEFRIDVAARDQPGLLAQVTATLAGHGYTVLDASAATWPDKAVLDSFRVLAPLLGPDEARLEADLRSALRQPLACNPLPGARVDFDDDGSPWHTLCTVEAADRQGLLQAITTAFAVNGVTVHDARIATQDGVARDRFSVTDRKGRKLDQATRSAVLDCLGSGVTPPRRRLPFRRHRPDGGVPPRPPTSTVAQAVDRPAGIAVVDIPRDVEDHESIA